MKRAILTPAIPPPSALAELKDWLGLAIPGDDNSLMALLSAALETCEAFTGIVPIAVPCEETLPARADWQPLSTVPVQAITGAATLSPGGQRTALQPSAFATDLHADGVGLIRLNTGTGTVSGTSAARIVVSFTAGLAPDWASLPNGLRHGVMRLAAHSYRERDAGTNSLPPASVAALWRPWRRLRLL